MLRLLGSSPSTLTIFYSIHYLLFLPSVYYICSMRNDIIDRKAEILTWIKENQSKAFICRQLHCRPSTLETALKKIGCVRSTEAKWIFDNKNGGISQVGLVATILKIVNPLKGVRVRVSFPPHIESKPTRVGTTC